MTTTLNPTITITVSGPTGSGKSRVLALIADVLKLIHGDCIIDAPDVKAEKEMCGNDYTAWHKPRSGTIFKLEEINQPINTGRCIYREAATIINKLANAQENRVETEAETRKKIQAAITTDDLLDRPVPVHIQALMSKLGISFEEYQETDLQPVADLVNWALMTPQTPENSGGKITDEISEDAPDTRCDNAGTKSAFSTTSKEGAAICKADSLIAEQLGQGGDWVTSRAGWEEFLVDTDKTTLLKVLTFSLSSARTSGRQIYTPPGTQPARTLNLSVLESGSSMILSPQERAEKIAELSRVIDDQINRRISFSRTFDYWSKTLPELELALLAEALTWTLEKTAEKHGLRQMP
ncbi:hypothetical protein DQ824_25495 [Salmonella enterica subsp. enterica serovar Newport]|nr:hypothetical protein [Salmonella enterica subsp. enterica serovar Newport]